MDRESFNKMLLIAVGGFAIFWLLKPKGLGTLAKSGDGSKSLSGDSMKVTEEDEKNAEVVMTAYMMALDNQEQMPILNELNSEFMKEFGLRAYQNKEGQIIVVNKVGLEVLKS